MSLTDTRLHPHMVVGCMERQQNPHPQSFAIAVAQSIPIQDPVKCLSGLYFYYIQVSTVQHASAWFSMPKAIV